MKILESTSLPAPAGHFSPAIEHNDVLYLSGQLPKHPITKEVPEGIEAQTKLSLENVENVLKAFGQDKTSVIRMVVYITDIAYWADVNRVYTEFFGDHKPVRCIIPIGPLNGGCLIEVECTAERI